MPKARSLEGLPPEEVEKILKRREYMRAQHRTRCQTPEVKARISELKRDYYRRPGVKERQAELKRENLKRPGVRERKNECNREYRKRPEVKEREAEKRREYHERPEVKAREAERRREYRKRPEVKARASAYHYRRQFAIETLRAEYELLVKQRELSNAVIDTAQALSDRSLPPNLGSI